MAHDLSPRQREILRLVASGRTSKEIAAMLRISENTVNWHIANTFDKLGAASRAEAIAIAYRDEADDGNPRSSLEAKRSPESSRHATAQVGVLLAVAILSALLGGATVAVLRGTP